MDCQSLALALQDLSTSIQDLAAHPPSFVLHRTQCLCLAKSYTFAIQHVTQKLHHVFSASSDSPAHQNLVPSLSELHYAVLQGHKFMCDCRSQDGWVKKSLVLALSTEAEDVCLHDLVWCLCVIHQAMGLLPLQYVDEPADNVYGTLNAIWAETSHEEDLRVLLDALERQIAVWKLQLLDDALSTSSRKGINEQYCLAEFLIQRLSRENENAGALLEGLPQCLWVDPHEITIKEAIGRGAYAVIHEVEWHGETFGQKEFFGVDEALFAREAAIQARLRHPNLLQLICCTSKPSRHKCGLVMELMDMDLQSMIRDRKNSGSDPPFSLLTSVDLMLQIAKGMEHLHSLYIMHRDLKSFNLLVSNISSMDESASDCRMRVKIADFGMSKAKNQSSRYTTPKAGTTYWMAPEVFGVDPERESKGHVAAKYTRKADVYSFAMVCYEILSGNIPFDDGRKRAELHQRLLKGERPTLPSSCPPYLANYIEKCWQGDPEKRPSFDQISRTFRHLKGILLSSANPLTSPALSARRLTLIENNLQQAIGANWPSNVSGGLTTKLMTISFEMSWYKVMECKLTRAIQGTSVGSRLRPWSSSAVKDPEIKIKEDRKSAGFFPKLLHCFDLSLCCGGKGKGGALSLCRGGKGQGSCCAAHTISEESFIPCGKAAGGVMDLPSFGGWDCVDEGFLRAQHIMEMPNSSVLKQYTLAELVNATNQTNQSLSSIPLGQGGRGRVSKGILADGQVVAVKFVSNTGENSHIHTRVQSFNTGQSSNLTELKLLGSIRHRNIVPLLGFCSHQDLLMLVYKFMPRGDLGRVLHDRSHQGIVLSWAQRYRIALGVARALLHLHHEVAHPIVHRDVKPSNILLDDDYEACLADFGIATFLADGGGTDGVRGTVGYMSPEYMMTLQLGLEADVYSFGVVMLELASGRSIADGYTLVQDVWKLYEQGRLADAVDERVRIECHDDNDDDDDDDVDEMNRLLLVGLACCQSNPRDRPTMLEVVPILSKEAEAPTPARAPA